MECLSFEEGHLRLSDAQFVLDWIESAQGPGCHGIALNYCEAMEGRFDVQSGLWKLELLDTLGGGRTGIAARWIVNAAGVWVDHVNSHFRVESPLRHLLAKGASITFARPKDHSDVLVFDDVGEREGMSLVPWGPVSLWGSTEQLIRSPDDGWQVMSADVEFLLDSLNRHMVKALRSEDVVALRCGVRPIVVRRGQTTGDPLSLSKRWCLWRDPHRPWISIYGGKLTACQSIARRTSELLRVDLGPPVPRDNGWPGCDHEPEMDWLAGLHVPSARWCVEHRMCWTLEDYLRRRTNIAQWVPRGGLGKEGEHVPQLADVAQSFAWTGISAADLVQNYERRIAREHDRVLDVYPSNGAAL
jgi:glycerol-3-phosphate dehydrogenase